MSTELKDFIKFVAGVIVILMIFMVIFTPEGIASNTFNYITYAEPTLLQDWLSTAITVGSSSPEEFITSMHTSGKPYTINIYTTDGITYVDVLLPEKEYLKTKFAKVEPVPVITNCKIQNQTIKLKENLVQTLTVRKFMNDSSCVITVSTSGITYQPILSPPPPPPSSCVCTNWIAIGPCGESPCKPNEVKYVRYCDPVGCDPGDGMGDSQCILDTSCTLGFDFSISLNPNSGVVNRGLQIETNAIVDVISGVRELVNLSASGLPSGATLSFQYQNFTPPATSKITIATTGSTPKGNFKITIRGESVGGLVRTAEYDLSVVEPGGCCPHVSILTLSPINEGDIFTVNLTYTHDIPNGGSVHLHWPSSRAKFISSSSSVPSTTYLPNTWNAAIMNGNDLVECGSETNRMYNYDTCNITLQALGGDIDLFYRAWDWTNDAVCAIGGYDYNRDPNSGTCSLKCDVFPDDFIICDTYNYKVTVKSLCGNGILNSGEECDGTNLNGKTCTDLGFLGGILSCKSDCTFNTSSCISSCVCSSWTNQNCGNGGCTSNQMYQTRTCNIPGCDIESQCVADFYTSGWTNQNCGNGGCTSNQMYQTRTSQYSCLSLSQCVADTCGGWSNMGCSPTGGCSGGKMYQTRTCTYGCLQTSRCVDDPVNCCSCNVWMLNTCGANGCLSNEMYQTRTCNPSGCNVESQCVADTCGGWSNQGCRLDGCTGNQMYQTRTCTYGCLQTSRCVDDPVNCCIQPNYWCDSASYTCPWFCTGCAGCTISVGGCYSPSQVPASKCIDCGWGLWFGCGFNCITSPNCYENLATCGCAP